MDSAIYARISSTEQSNYSIEVQLDRCREYAAGQGWAVVNEYTDPGFSGRFDDRPQFQQMIADALAGQFQYIIVLSFDRLFRNMEHAVIYKSLLEKDGIRVISVMEPVDHSSPNGFLHEGILDLFAAYYSKQLAAKIRAGLTRAVQSGKWPHKPPRGYSVDENGKIVISDDGKIVALAFKEFATGRYTLETWANEAYRLGLRSNTGGKIRGSTWSHIFHNKFYIGMVKLKNVEAEGHHPPLIDEATFYRVHQALLKNNPAPPRVVRYYLLRGLLYSLDADSIMSGAVAVNPKGVEFRYYRSRKAMPDGKRHHVPVEKLESQIFGALEGIGFDLYGPTSIARQVDEAMLLALRVAPNMGVIYQNLPNNEQRQKFLRLVVARHGMQISGNSIVSVTVKPPFYLLDRMLVDLPVVEQYSLFTTGVQI